MCTECTIDQGFNQFLGEVLGGKHKDVIDEIEERLSNE